MKKILLTIVVVGVCAALSALAPTANQTKAKMNTKGKKLVVYFSRVGENYNVGVIKKGNTRIVADMIAEATGADRFEIVPATPYPSNYNECIALAKKELNADARPTVNGDVAIEDYDVIFIGYPNWWGEAPMCVYTFIEKHDWRGKTVIPFITHEGSGMSGTDRSVGKACQGANVTIGKGLAIQGKTAQTNQASARQSVNRWLKDLGF